LHIDMINQNLGLWAYLVLALLVLVEGPIATLAGAVAASAGLMKPEGVFLAAASGNLTADSLWYLLGFLGKMEWLERYGRWVGISREILQTFKEDIRKHAAKVLFIAKITLGFSIPALVSTGLARVPIMRWAPWLVVGETILTGSLVLLGYHFGKYIQKLEFGVKMVALGGAFLSVAFLVFYIGRLRQKQNRERFDALL